MEKSSSGTRWPSRSTEAGLVTASDFRAFDVPCSGSATPSKSATRAQCVLLTTLRLTRPYLPPLRSDSSNATVEFRRCNPRASKRADCWNQDASTGHVQGSGQELCLVDDVQRALYPHDNGRVLQPRRAIQVTDSTGTYRIDGHARRAPRPSNSPSEDVTEPPPTTAACPNY